MFDMTIAILTFHRALSFGANLQCYALQETLKSLGCNAGVLDYRQPYIEKHYKPFQLHYIRRYLLHPRGLILYLLDWKRRGKTYNLFRSFQNCYFNLISFNGKELPRNVDKLLIGSDQMWSINYTGGIDECYFGNISHTNIQQIATYALSANENSLMQIGELYLKRYSENFSYFSFREANIATLFKKMTGKDSILCLDPTLLTCKSTWEPLIDKNWKNHNYVVVFQVHVAGGNMKNAVNIAKEIAKKSNLEVININNMIIDPSAFISIIRFAKFVVTTSFHGTAFSIIFHREFVTLKVNETIDARSSDILSKLNIGNRMISLGESLPLSKIDYNDVDEKLNSLRISSIEYLKTFIS